MNMIKYEYKLEPAIQAEEFNLTKYLEDSNYYPMIKKDNEGNLVCKEDGSCIKHGDFIIQELDEDRYYEYYVMDKDKFHETFREVKVWDNNLQ